MKRSIKKAAAALMITGIVALTGSISSYADEQIMDAGFDFCLNLYDGRVLTEAGEEQAAWVLQQDIWYYRNADGTAQTGWLNENGNWYYLNTDGAMQTSWLNENGSWYYLNSDGKMVNGWLNLGKDWYYLNPDGKMTNGWLNENGNWYYLNPDGKMANGWLNQGKDWYYLNPDGKMANGWLNLGNDWYYLNSDGKMANGWLNLNGSWYYLYEDGRMAADAWIASNYVDANGVWLENPAQNQLSVSDNPANNTLEKNENVPENSESAESLETVDKTETEKPAETVDIIEPAEVESEHLGTEITPEYLTEKLEHLRVKYPDGMYWNHMGYTAKQRDTNYYSETVTSIPCNHGMYGTDYCNAYINYSLAYVIGMQCDGFARKLSDEIFGTDAKKTDYVYSFDVVKVGDYIRYNNAHTVLVVAKDEKGIQVAECNIGGTCVIRWGRRITREELDRNRSMTCFTRY